MKTTPLPRFFRGVPLLLTTALAPMGLWAQPQQCPIQNTTLNGAYVSHATGFAGGNPLAVVGITTYDGHGNFQLSATVSVNGTILRPPTGTGTYTVNRDCTGSQTIGSSHYDFVVTPDGREVTYISTDPGAVITVTSVRLASKGEDDSLGARGMWAQPQQCPLQNATLNGAYVSHATGFAGGNPLAVVGITTYDGHGNFQLSATVSVNGTILRPPTGTGTYTVNRDCTGSQTIGSSHYDFVVTPDGREVTYISTDPGTVITVTSVRLVSKGEDDSLGARGMWATPPSFNVRLVSVEEDPANRQTFGGGRGQLSF